MLCAFKKKKIYYAIVVLTRHCCSSSLCCLRMEFTSSLCLSRSAYHTRRKSRATDSKLWLPHWPTSVNSLITTYFYRLQAHFGKTELWWKWEQNIRLCPAASVFPSVEWWCFARACWPSPDSAVPTHTPADPEMSSLHSTLLAEQNT